MDHYFVQRFDVFVDRWGVRLLRLSLGIVFCWFGILKFFEGMSPAEDLAGRTIHTLSLGAVPAETAVPLLAAWETLMGVALISGVLTRVVTVAMLVHLAGTVTPLFFYPQEAFTRVPFAPTLVGQYIIKNLVLASAVLVVSVAGRRVELLRSPTKAPSVTRLQPKESQPSLEV